MGGLGSGRHGYGQAAKTHEYHAIDLAYMNRRKLLRVGSSGTLTWTRGSERTGWIRYKVEHHGLMLSYKTRCWGEDEWQPIDELVPFAWSNTQFGGTRRWFRCLSCGRRCRVVYGGGYFRCRKCYQLKYETQYERPWGRAITKAQKIRQRLGGDGSMDDWFPEKPKGMHWKTYRRLEAIDADAQDLWAGLLAVWLKV